MQHSDLIIYLQRFVNFEISKKQQVTRRNITSRRSPSNVTIKLHKFYSLVQNDFDLKWPCRESDKQSRVKLSKTDSNFLRLVQADKKLLTKTMGDDSNNVRVRRVLPHAGTIPQPVSLREKILATRNPRCPRKNTLLFSWTTDTSPSKKFVSFTKLCLMGCLTPARIRVKALFRPPPTSGNLADLLIFLCRYTIAQGYLPTPDGKLLTILPNYASNLMESVLEVP